ncbi:beta-ketoacyl-[acyl-carrier-protein] synthase family protein [Streptomyces cyaneofuscatus]
MDFSCAVSAFDAGTVLGTEARRMDAFTQYAVAAAREAVADAAPGDGGWDPARVGVLIGTGVGGLGTWLEQSGRMLDTPPRPVNPLTVPKAIGNMAAATVALDLGLNGPALSLATACATGTTALGIALDLLRAGRCDVVLAEGAGVLVLELAAGARARGRRPYAKLMGYGEASDAYHLTSPDPDGKGAQLAVRGALADAGLSPSDVALVNAHATGTPQGDAVEARLIDRLFGSHTAVTAAKGVTGHMLGAAGAVEAAFTALSIDDGVIPPTANFAERSADVPGIDIVHGAARHAPVPFAVSNSFGFGGHNAVAVLGRA